MIYSVEDDEQVRRMVLYALEQSGLPARGFADATAFWQAVEARVPDLVLLDVMLPGEDGLHILRCLRAQPATRRVPVIMLTARGEEMERVEGLTGGADDYVVKPFSVLELIARVKALLRRAAPEALPERLASVRITLDAARRTVDVDGAGIELTRREFDLLYTLMQNSGIVLGRERLLEMVWDAAYAGNTRTVDAHILTLRQKLGAGGGAIETVRGVGYRFAEDLVDAE